MRDDSVMQFCMENNIKCIEKVSHTLWNPKEIIKKNGGIPPTTFKKFHVFILFLCDFFPTFLIKYYLIFQNITNEIGHPPKPVPNIDWLSVNFGELPISILEEFTVYNIILL